MVGCSGEDEAAIDAVDFPNNDVNVLVSLEEFRVDLNCWHGQGAMVY